MAHYSATVDVAATPADAFAFLSDPLNRGKWDPSVREVVAEGDHHAVTVGFYGKAIETTCTIEELVEPSRIVFATGGRVRGRDVIEIGPREDGSTITIDLEVRMSGPARLLDRGLQLAFAGIGDNIVRELTRCLDGGRSHQG